MSAFRLLLVLTGLAIYFVFRQFVHVRAAAGEAGSAAAQAAPGLNAFAVR